MAQAREANVHSAAVVWAIATSTACLPLRGSCQYESRVNMRKRGALILHLPSIWMVCRRPREGMAFEPKVTHPPTFIALLFHLRLHRTQHRHTDSGAKMG